MQTVISFDTAQGGHDISGREGKKKASVIIWDSEGL